MNSNSVVTDLFFFFFFFFFSNSVRLFIVTFFYVGLQPVFFISLDVHDYCTFTCIMCKMECKATNGTLECKVTNVIKMSILLILYLIFST